MGICGDTIGMVATDHSWLANHTYHLKRMMDLEIGDYLWTNGKFGKVELIEKTFNPLVEGQFVLLQISKENDAHPYIESEDSSEYLEDPTLAIVMAAIYSGVISCQDDVMKVQHSDSEVLKLIQQITSEMYPEMEVDLDLKNHLITLKNVCPESYLKLAQEHDAVAWMISKQSKNTYQKQWETYWGNLFNPENHSSGIIQTDEYMAAILCNWSQILKHEFHYHRIEKDKVLVSRNPIIVPKSI